MRLKPIRFLSSVLVVATISAQAHAVQIRGARSCGEWVEQNKAAGFDAVASQAWVVGFLSGMAFQSNKDILKGTDNESLFLWLTKYCQANPLSSLADAAEALSIELIKLKGSKP